MENWKEVGSIALKDMLSEGGADKVKAKFLKRKMPDRIFRVESYDGFEFIFSEYDLRGIKMATFRSRRRLETLEMFFNDPVVILEP